MSEAASDAITFAAESSSKRWLRDVAKITGMLDVNVARHQYTGHQHDREQIQKVKYTNTLTTTSARQMPERYENFWPTPKNFWQPENFRLLRQLGGAASPSSTPSNTPMQRSSKDLLHLRPWAAGEDIGQHTSRCQRRRLGTATVLMWSARHKWNNWCTRSSTSWQLTIMMMKYSWSTWLCSSDENDDDDRTAQAMQNRRLNVGLMSGHVRSVMQQFHNRRFQRWSQRYFHSTDYLREISSLFLGVRVGIYCLLLSRSDFSGELNYRMWYWFLRWAYFSIVINLLKRLLHVK